MPLIMILVWLAPELIPEVHWWDEPDENMTSQGGMRGTRRRASIAYTSTFYD